MPRPNVSLPAPTLSRYDRMPKKIINAESTIAVKPKTSVVLKRGESARGRVASIVPAAIAPEIRPKVQTAFFIANHLLVNVCRPQKYPDLPGAVVILLGDSEAQIEKSCFCMTMNYGMSPAALPNWTAWVRLLAPSFSNNRLEWVL